MSTLRRGCVYLTSQTTLTIPEGVTEIPYEYFSDCNTDLTDATASITAINFPDSLLAIRASAFRAFVRYPKTIETIELPSTIQIIEGSALSGPWLKTVTMRDVGVRTQPLRIERGVFMMHNERSTIRHIHVIGPWERLHSTAFSKARSMTWADREDAHLPYAPEGSNINWDQPGETCESFRHVVTCGSVQELQACLKDAGSGASGTCGTCPGQCALEPLSSGLAASAGCTGLGDTNVHTIKVNGVTCSF
jgi:hypothetical protein